MPRPMPQEPMKLSDEEYNKRFVQLAREWITSTKCYNCGSPRVQGFVCTFCNKDDSEARANYQTDMRAWREEREAEREALKSVADHAY